MSLLYPEESYRINGAIYEVHKELGPGLLEKVYQEALEKELILQGIPYEREKDFTIMYKGEELDQKYIADFVCYGKIVVELKAVDEILPVHKAQSVSVEVVLDERIVVRPRHVDVKPFAARKSRPCGTRAKGG